MRRFFLITFFVLSLPLLSTTSRSGYAPSVALAGHVIPSGYCSPCGCGPCICDPGEQPGDCNGGQSARIGDGVTDIKPTKPARGDVDFGSLGILGLVVMFLIRRFTA